MGFRHLTAIALCCWALTSAAEQPLPAKLTISYVQHDAVINYYKPLMARAYAKLGIQIKFTKVNIQRSLELLNKGDIDGDVIRAGVAIRPFANIVKVPPPLDTMKVELYCQTTLPCNPDALQNSHALLGLIGTLKIHHPMLQNAKVKIMQFNNYDQMKKMFELKRLDYIININDANPQLNNHVRAPYQHYPLFQNQGFHMLNKKWAYIIPRLTAAIKQAQIDMPKPGRNDLSHS